MHLVSEYIQAQAMQDLPKHSRDLHTSIVAAFTTLLVWVQAHPYLLGSKVSSYMGWEGVGGVGSVKYVVQNKILKEATSI